MYLAKEEGKNDYRFFSNEIRSQSIERLMLETSLRNALELNQFQLHYQPKIDVETNAVNGVEALLRWTHPERHAVPPAEFIPVAEETGLIVPLGEWALRRACAEAAHWPDAVRVAVNLSPVQFRNRGLVAMVTQALASAGLPATRLEIEITEAALLQKDEMTVAMLHQLRALGVRISMDDFGTGYSSLSYLRSFPFDKIKIDRSFIQDLTNGSEPRAIVHAVAGLAKCLNMISTAEGVETQQQLDTLQAVGCTEMQGYLFSRARPAKEIGSLFAPDAGKPLADGESAD